MDLTSVSRRRAGAILAVLFSCCTSAGAQNVTEPSLKAAFIYNFAKFTEWPQSVLPASVPFVSCVLGDATVGDALARAVQGRLLSGRSVTVSRVEVDGNLRACHLLYVSGVTPEQLAQVLTSVRGAPVLTISDADDFARRGGMAHLFVEGGKMRFALSLELTRRSRLQLSSKLLILASRIYDESDPVGR